MSTHAINEKSLIQADRTARTNVDTEVIDMTREEARQNLVALGIEEPTDAQVTNYLNQFHSNRNPNPNPPTPNPAPAPNPNPAPNPTPAPQPTPAGGEELDGLRQQIAELQRENARKDIAAYAVSKGLAGDQVENILNAFGENIEVAKQAIDSISQIISDNRTAAAQEKEQELANKATNPGGGSGGGKDEKTTAVKMVEKIYGGKKADNDILSHYVSGGK